MKNKDEAQFLSVFFFNLENENQRVCALIIDKVYVKSFLQYCGETVIGRAADRHDEIANTLLCIMVKCMMGVQPFIVKMLPVKTLDATCDISLQ